MKNYTTPVIEKLGGQDIIPDLFYKGAVTGHQKPAQIDVALCHAWHEKSGDITDHQRELYPAFHIK